MNFKNVSLFNFHIDLLKILLISLTGMVMLPSNNLTAQTKLLNKQTYVYVSSYTRSPENSAVPGIHVFQFSSDDGSLTLIQQIPGVNPSWIELSPSRRFLYVCYSLRDKEGAAIGSIEAYKINSNTGKLKLLNRIPLNSGPAQMAVSPNGKQLVVANYFFGNYVVLPIKKDGSLEPIVSSLQNSGKGALPRQDSPHPHAVVFDRSGLFIGAADLGIDRIETFRLVQNNLERTSEVSVTPGTGPRHIAFSKDNKILYMIGELSGKITAYTYDAETGNLGKEIQTVLTTPENYSGVQSGAEIMVHPSGKFLYASNRGSKTIVGYKIDDTNGKLLPINFVKDGVENPTSFTIDPEGKWLYVPNNGGKDIVQFDINLKTGELKSTGRKTMLSAPNIMVFRTPV